MKHHQVVRLQDAIPVAVAFINKTTKEEKEKAESKRMDAHTIRHLARLDLRYHFRPRVFKETELEALAKIYKDPKKYGLAVA